MSIGDPGPRPAPKLCPALHTLLAGQEVEKALQTPQAPGAGTHSPSLVVSRTHGVRP